VAEGEWDAGSKYVSGCLDGTREDLLTDMFGWYDNPNSPSFYWLTGTPGTGKTAVMCTACERFSQRNVLGASFFISRYMESCRKMESVITTMAYRLSFTFPQLRPHISSALEDETLLGPVPQRQLRKLIIHPIRRIADSLTSPILLVIDALDECEGDSIETVSNMLDLLISEITKFPTPIKVILTSRREDYLRGILILNATKIQAREIESFIPVTGIEIYIKSRMLLLEKVFRIIRGWTPEAVWPSDDDIRAVKTMSGQLFLSAVTVLRILESQSIIDDPDPDPRRTLRMLKESMAESSMSGPARDMRMSKGRDSVVLDAWYLEVLKLAARCHPTLKGRNNIRLLLAFIVLAFNHLSKAEIDSLLKIKSGDYFPVLHAIVEVPDDGKPIRTLHASFYDFMTDPLRCTDSDLQFINPQQYHATLAKACLRKIATLSRNILKVSSAYQTNQDLEESITENFSGDIRYAVKYWIMHIEGCSPEGTLEDEEVIKSVSEFARSGILHWIEALSYLIHLRQGRDAVERLKKLIAVRFDPT
jgi:hypothetical protein